MSYSYCWSHKNCPACLSRNQAPESEPMIGDEIRSFICCALRTADDSGPRDEDAKQALEELAAFVWLAEGHPSSPSPPNPVHTSAHARRPR